MDWRAVPCIFAGFFLFVLFPLSIVFKQYNAEKFFSAALNTHDISTEVLVDGRRLSIRSGKVTLNGTVLTGLSAHEALRLGYARTIAERSPLFALPGTSPSDLTYAVNELQQTAYQLADIQKDAASSDFIRNSLYPIDFLHKAAKAEALRLEFIAAADLGREQAYYDAIDEEFSSYLLGIRNFRDGVIRMVPDQTPPFVAAGKFISKEAILSALVDIEERAKKTKKLFDARILCLRGRTSNCNPQDLQLPTLREQPTGTVPSDSIRAALSIKSIYANIGDDDQIRNAPLIALSQNVCAYNSPSPPIYVVAMPKIDSGAPALRRGIYMGDIRVININEYKDLPFYQSLQSKGIEFVLSPPLLHYECMDEARDLSAILFTENIMRESSSTASVYFQSDAIRIANDRARAGDSAGIQYVLSAQNHSTHFDQSLRDISWIERTNVNLNNNGAGTDLRTYNLFFSRSGFVSLFAVNNPSFVGDAALFDSLYVPSSEQPYLYYSSLSDGIKKNKLLQDMRSYVSLHLKHLPTTQ